MNILYLNYEFPPIGGGASSVSFDIAKCYAELGHRVDVVTMGFHNLQNQEIKENVNIIRVKCLRRKKEICHPWEQMSYLVSGYIKCIKLIRDNNYNICHAHFILPTGVLAYILKLKYKIPYIISSHGSDVPGHNKDRFKYLHKITKPFFKIICRNAKFVTTPSKYLAGLINKTVENINIKIIPNGSKNYLLSTIKKENIILSSGRLHKSKGFHHLIKSFNKLKLSDWKLYIVGDGPYRNELKRLAKNNKNIIFTGWLNNNSYEFSKILNQAKIFSLLSDTESQSISYVEAMSTGCALLYPNIAACKEAIPPNAGICVNTKNICDIKNKLLKQINSPDLLNNHSKNSLNYYLNFYTWNKIIKKYEKLLYL